MSNEAAGGKTEAVKTANQIENRDLNRTCTQSGVKIDHCSSALRCIELWDCKRDHASSYAPSFSGGELHFHSI